MFGCGGLIVAAKSFGFGVYLSCLLTRKVPKETASRTLSCAKGSLKIPQRGWGFRAFDARKRVPIEAHLNPPVFGRSRTKTGGFVAFGVPSVELLWRCVIEMGLSVTDRRDIAGDVWGIVGARIARPSYEGFMIANRL